MKIKQFTLVELLIIMAIFAIFAGMLLPALDAQATAAQAVSCVNNQKQGYVAIRAYANDYNNYFYSSSKTHYAYTTEPTWPRMSWSQKLELGSYISGAKDVLCPVANKVHHDNVYGAPYFSNEPYAYSLDNIEKGVSIGKGTNDNLAIPSLIPLLVDSGKSGSTYQSFRLTSKYDGSGLIYMAHENKANIVYFDGHAGSVAEDEVGKTLSLMSEGNAVYAELITKYIDAEHEIKDVSN